MNATEAPALARLQSDFQRHLLGRTSPVIDAVRPGCGIDARARLGIYHHAYRARLVDALRDVHGHCAACIGEDTFDALAREFIEAHPPGRESLRWYGAAFADWLAGCCPEQPGIAELARLDAALRKAFDGPDAPTLALAAVAAIDAGAWPRVVFVAHPTCARLVLAHNTLERWQAIDQDQAPPPAAPLATCTQLLVWRRDLQPHFRSLARFECEALDGVFAGDTFAAICARLSERFAGIDVAAEAGRLLRRWIDEGLLSALRQVSAPGG